ncbi:terminase small subunit [Acuticoccus sp. MNP-M23]|uniref:terminase small subunit n=1 Tax=Acuticoccus sp. MNP-M23 TaxID=3072793 RepID=UPI0028160850|nr:terminase small subunit [Acuticoccus sp. MNP-M23]WMS42290.1 terminase small subunit [Acuticoccus sp. MNP-M23]
MNVTALGDCLGITARQVQRLCKMGVLQREDRGLYDLKENTRRYCQRLRDNIPSSDPNAIDCRRERALLARSQREHQEMKNARQRQDVIDCDTAIATFQTVLVQIRKAMLDVPARVRSRLPNMSPFDINELDREIRQGLASAADGGRGGD